MNLMFFTILTTVMILPPQRKRFRVFFRKSELEEVILREGHQHKLVFTFLFTVRVWLNLDLKTESRRFKLSNEL